MNKITLKNIKNIKFLEFEIPSQGVWLLTGTNGCGKTSLLIGLHRIGLNYAFNAFRVGEHNLDVYEDGEIQYTVGEKYVTYRRRKERWRGVPSANCNIFQDFGFSNVIFVTGDNSRLRKTTEDKIKSTNVQKETQDFKDFLAYVLDDQKWQNLCYVNTHPGTGNHAYLLKINNKYYSEKNFSLGEISVLRLAEHMYNLSEKTLILIDEIEMALHPKAQVKLLEKINEIAKEKKLTIIFSTHSSTLIKTHPKKNILYIKEQDTNIGHFDILKNPYTAQILGDIAYDDELSLDYLFFTEDEQAKHLLNAMLKDFFQQVQMPILPLIKIIPVGGFKEVVKMLKNSSQVFPNHVKRYAFLDKDVSDEGLKEVKKHEILQLFNTYNKNIKYLPSTPELGIIEMLTKDSNKISTLFSSQTQHQIHFSQMLNTKDFKKIESKNDREKAKNQLGHIVEQLKLKTGETSESLYKTLYSIYSQQLEIGMLKEFFNPIIKS